MQLKKPEMILFDYGGTLLCEPDWNLLRGEKAVFQHVVYNPYHYTPEDISAWETNYFQSLQSVRDADAELTEIQLLRLKYELHGIKLDIPYEQAELILWDHTAPMSERCVYPNIKQVLSSLHEQRVRTGVISNIGWTGTALTRRINMLLPDNHFEFILASSDYGIRKPNIKFFHAALAKAELKPEQAWFCGDTYEKDIAGARAVGLFTVFYQGQAEGGSRRSAVKYPDAADSVMITDWLELLKLLEKTV